MVIIIITFSQPNDTKQVPKGLLKGAGLSDTKCSSTQPRIVAPQGQCRVASGSVHRVTRAARASVVNKSSSPPSNRSFI